jgi:hypothetical protein
MPKNLNEIHEDPTPFKVLMESCDLQTTKNKANDNWFVKQVESIINNDQYEGKKNNSL